MFKTAISHEGLLRKYVCTSKLGTCIVQHASLPESMQVINTCAEYVIAQLSWSRRLLNYMPWRVWRCPQPQRATCSSSRLPTYSIRSIALSWPRLQAPMLPGRPSRLFAGGAPAPQSPESRSSQLQRHATLSLLRST